MIAQPCAIPIYSSAVAFIRITLEVVEEVEVVFTRESQEDPLNTKHAQHRPKPRFDHDDG